MAHQITPCFLASLILIVLLVCSGCTSTPPPTEVPVNETPTLPVLYHNNVAIDLAGIEINDPELFTANLTSTITTVLPDSRAGLLLDHGWSITSVRQEFDEEVLERPYVLVEFMKNGLSFYIMVDEEEGRVIGGYCGAEVWVAGPISGPLPKDYSQALDKSTRRMYVFDHRNGGWDGDVMIYDQNGIYYLNPDF
ncbi:MAG: hypothetical protein PHP59_00470 [Methanofollis sp.]|uniref:hypothetical protein n=1 Tax=Methanofollis sp. TaxID=2052835 RepID=UPI002624C167|nr:hypothetical protein [Methanofollis sp.]MDD4253836.1 hypothetical protein [Methanofollis sp.]